MKALGDPQTITTVDLLRHGHCQGGEIYRGSTDVALSETGWAQMRDSVEQHLESERGPWDKIVSSPLTRCRVFAEQTSERLAIPLCIEPDFREYSFGEWEGRIVKEVYTETPEAVRAFYRDPENNAPPGGENFVAFRERLVNAWEKLFESHQGQHLLLIQHGASIRGLLLHFLAMPSASMTRLEVPYAGMIRLRIISDDTGHRPVLSRLNHVFGV
ncbi:histidine phosphatase family protein [Marinibactrum halimedae]|uniref:Histidine phosphatase family protein n=1 Tax=Marinibactrum halimedae TaxID=1444977 RepID=A0AA37T8L1_9GAMM|nr:histidine phosphatase family protein [Marinibactrum halimedae]MCD9459372.1 histidine phosphatase family protein [Marinibactrum halimedae]GLS27564.1 hypothetical protein GCM10007877_32830 [Marinibactrum halimedae]